MVVNLFWMALLRWSIFFWMALLCWSIFLDLVFKELFHKNTLLSTCTQSFLFQKIDNVRMDLLSAVKLYFYAPKDLFFSVFFKSDWPYKYLKTA